MNGRVQRVREVCKFTDNKRVEATNNQANDKLGVLAMLFRGCKHHDDVLEKRKAIAAEYAAVVDELIESGNWTETPAMEEQLTDEYMPERFFTHWGIR